jgi:predicted enzyme related to lactoylglutathione lyase
LCIRLTDGRAPADGPFDLRFTLYDSPEGGTRPGSQLLGNTDAQLLVIKTSDTATGPRSSPALGRAQPALARAGLAHGRPRVLHPAVCAGGWTIRTFVLECCHRVRAPAAPTPNPRRNLMNRIMHFEIHATDPETLVPFYRDLFGWKIEKWGDGASAGIEYWMISTGEQGTPGIDGGLLRRQGAGPQPGAPVNGYVCTIVVDDLDALLAKATSLGATIALPKDQVPGIGWLAYFMDPDHNVFGMLQPDM